VLLGVSHQHEGEGILKDIHHGQTRTML
jgi:Zn-dependent M32 family carboxypeptidase